MKNKAIESIFERWIERQVIRNQNLDIKLVIHDTYFDGQSQRLFQKYGTGMTYNSFLSDYITALYLAMKEFDATDSEWSRMADSESESRLDELKKYVYRKVRFLVIDEFKVKTGVKRMSINNKNINVALEVLSLDYVYSDSYTMTEALTTDAQLNAGHEYHQSWYKRWFDSVKSDVLTTSQLELLADLEGVNVDEMSVDEFKLLTGIDKSKLNTRLDAIADRILKAYNKQQPLDDAGKKKLEQYLMLEEMVAIMKEKDAQNRLRKHVRDQYFFYSDLLTLSHTEAEALTESLASNDLVMEVCQQLLSKREELEEEIETLKGEWTEIERSHKFVKQNDESIVNNYDNNGSVVFTLDTAGMLLQK